MTTRPLSLALPTSIALAVSLAAPSPSPAQLTSDEIAILAMKESTASQEVAKHYAKVRNVPESRILLLEGPPGGVVSRKDWETRLRPRIRRWLLDQGLEGRIRCMLTTYDVPLVIDRRDPSLPGVKERKEFLRVERRRRAEQIVQLIHALDSLLPDPMADKPAPMGPEIEGRVLAQRFEDAIRSAQQRVVAEKDKPQGKSAAATYERIFIAGAGAGGLARMLSNQQNQDKLSSDVRLRLELLRGQILGFAAGLVALENLPDTVERDQQILSLLQNSDGLVGSFAWVERQIEILEANETYASFDSELSLLYWPHYPLIRSQGNLLHHGMDANPAQRLRHTLMVSRLEAPTVELTKRLVDVAVEVEKTGLSGKVYIDARGIPDSTVRGSNGEYDESLRDLAELLRGKSGLEVVLDEGEKLFSPGACPDAALYCGWYSLGNYVDAFEWKPGAVGYHLASMEAQTLRNKDSNVWCKRMLEEGVSATLGPVHEPYLIAFPLPQEFFGALATGKLTLVECYYRTLPFNSWVMVLVGDPLYRPFAAKPALEPGDLPLKIRKVLGPIK